VHVAGFATCRGLNAPANTHREAADVSAVSGAAFIIRRALMERLGGFDEGFFMYVEDTDLSWRAQLLGARCRYVPESIVAHQYRLDLSANKTYFLERNRWQLLLKCYQARTLLCLLPALIFGEILAWGYAALRGPAHLRAKLRAVSWIWVHRSEIGAHRAAVQTNRRAGDEGLLHLATVYPPIGLIAPGPVTRMLGSIAAIPFAISRWLTLTIVRPRR
jgi:GT2 family glycosyltransferase